MNIIDLQTIDTEMEILKIKYEGELFTNKIRRAIVKDINNMFKRLYLNINFKVTIDFEDDPQNTKFKVSFEELP